MSRRKITVGSSSIVIPVFVQDTSSIVGGGLGSLTYNSANLAAKYRREGDTSWSTITLQNMTPGVWASGGFVADGGPVTGGYDFGVPNAALLSGAKWVEVMIYGAVNMLPVLIEIELDTLNYQTSGGKVPATIAAGDLAVGAIDVPQFSSVLMQLLSRRASLTGVTANPITADTYKLGGFYNDTVYYGSTTLETPVYLWYSGTQWVASTVLGTTGSDYFTASAVNGIWSTHGSATGTITAVAHGNAVLSSFQPEVSSNGTIATALAAAVGNSVNIQNNIVVPPSVAVASQVPSTVTCIRGDTLRRVLPLMGNLSSRTKLTFTVKKTSVLNDGTNTDAQALIQIVEGTGIETLMGSASGFSNSDASLTVTDATTGEVTLFINASATSRFPIDDLAWDCQATLTTGITTPIGGVFSVSADVTQSI